MSKQYVPNRLRGVLSNSNEDGMNGPSKVSSSRYKGRKSRPWRVDAASWKQQLQERKAVYDHFSLTETSNEDQSKTQHQHQHQHQHQREETTTTARNPSFDQGEQVETVLLLKTPSTTATTSQPISITRTISSIDNDNYLSNEYSNTTTDNNCISPRRGKFCNSASSSSNSTVLVQKSPRKSSPLPRNRNTILRKSPKKKKSTSERSTSTSIGINMTAPSPHRARCIDDFDCDDDNDDDWRNDDELMASRSIDVSDNDEDGGRSSSERVHRSNDPNFGTINNRTTKNMMTSNNNTKPKPKVKLLRYLGDSSDDAETVGLTASQEMGQIPTKSSTRSSASSLSSTAAAKLTMMEAVEEFIDSPQIKVGTTTTASKSITTLPLRHNKSRSSSYRMRAAAEENNSGLIRTSATTVLDIDNMTTKTKTTNGNYDDYDKDGIIAAHCPGINTYDNEVVGGHCARSPVRRGGRRRPRSTTTTISQLSPASSTTSTTATVMGHSRSNNIFRCIPENEKDNDKPDDQHNDRNDVKPNDTYDSETQAGIYDDDDDNWSIRPVPSDEEVCLQKRRWPLRRDSSTAMTTSTDDDIITVKKIVFVSSASKKQNKGYKIKKYHEYSINEERSSDERASITLTVSTKKEPPRNDDLRNELISHSKISTDVKRTAIYGNDTVYHDINFDRKKDNDWRAMESTVSPDPLQKARKTLLMSNLNRSDHNLQESSLHSQQDDEDTIGNISVASTSTNCMFVPLRPPPVNRSHLNDSQQFAKKNNLNLLNNHGVYVSEYNEHGVFVPTNEAPTYSIETPTRAYASQYNKHGAFVPTNEATIPPSDTMYNHNSIDKDKDNLLDVMDSQHDKISNFSYETVQTHKNYTTSKNPGNDIYNDDKNDTRGTEDPKSKLPLLSSTVIEGNASTGINTEPYVTLSSEENLKNSDVNDGVDVSKKVEVSLAESVQINNSNDTDTDPDSSMFEKILSGPDPTFTEKYGLVEDKEIDDDKKALDEIDAAKIRVISDLKRRVGLIHAGDHVLVETIGTSEDLDPVSTALRKRALIKKGEKDSREKIEFKAELTNTVYSMNTDHHHVVESPGKLISMKGKKWKERMDMKKAAKKNCVQVDEKIKTVNVNDTTSKKEPSRDDLMLRNTEQYQDIQSLDRSNKAPKAEKPDDIADVIVEKDSTINNNSEKSKDVSCTKVMGVEDVNYTNLHQDTDSNNNGNMAQDEESDGVNMASTSQNTKDADTTGNYADSTDFNSGDEKQGLCVELDLPSAENSDVIQGLPPNKGKKWKDRLKKKKNKKQDIAGSGKMNGTAKRVGGKLLNRGDAAEGESDYALQSTPDEKISSNENTQETTHAIISSDCIEAISPQSENSTVRPSFNRTISDLTAPPEDKLRVSPINDEVCRIEPLVSPGQNGGKKSNKWKNRLAKMRVSKLPAPDKTRNDDQQDRKTDQTIIATHLPVDSNHLSSPEILPIEIVVPAECNTQSSDEKKANLILTKENLRCNPDVTIAQQYAPDLSTSEDKSLIQSDTTSRNIDSDQKESGIHNNLRRSFTAFDAFLKDRPAVAAPKDDESIYTEMTIGQESIPKFAVSTAQTSEEEEQSYMDFTIEESVQPAYVDQNVESKVAANNQLMSPFMSNLLSSRMFQDIVPAVPLNSIQQQQQQEQSNPTESSDENTKKFPTITVGDCFDDDMTQITMDHLSVEDDETEQDTSFDDQFFDSVSEHITRSTSLKSVSKKSRRSLNSRKSESASSFSSQLSCSEVSKQRIVEILRKKVWSRDIKVVRSAIEELYTEAKNGSQHRAHIVRCGGVMTTIRTMEMNASCECIQVLCCLTLEKLAMDPETHLAICEMEGVSLILKSMQDHVDNTQVQEAACMALATICRQQEVETSQDPIKNAEGAVSTLLSCMTQYTTNFQIQAKAFTAITNLCTHNHKRLAELSKAGGIMTLTMALQSPWENKNDQHEAISNLSILLRGITELNDNMSSSITVEEISGTAKQDGTSLTSSETESMSTKVDDNNNTMQNIGTEKLDEINKGEVADDDDGSHSNYSYIEDIPDLPMMTSNLSLNVEQIPDLGQLPTMLSNLEWQSDHNNHISPGEKIASTGSPRLGNGIVVQRDNGEGDDEEEKCSIQ